jgi:hypothetical protein
MFQLLEKPSSKESVHTHIELITSTISTLTHNHKKFFNLSGVYIP